MIVEDAPPRRPSMRTAVVALSTRATLIIGCSAGPHDQRPSMAVPADYKESGPWKAAQPRPADSTTSWWMMFGDAGLERLVEQANRANRTIAQTEALYRQASALADAARAAFWPRVGATAGALTNGNGIKESTTLAVGLNATWAPELCGDRCRAVGAGEAGAAGAGAGRWATPWWAA